MDKTLLYLNSKTSKLINRISVPPFQKQPFADIHRKTPVFESLSNKVVIKKKLQRRCFTMNIAKFFRKAFFIEQTGGCFCPLPLPLPLIIEKHFLLICLLLPMLASDLIHV